MRVRLTLACLLVASTASAEELAPWQEATLSEIRSMKRVVEAIFPQGATGSLWVSVQDDGTRRDGLAEAFCLDMSAAGRPKNETTVVHIWDAAAMARSEMVELGQAIC